jgi:hypothetical protein
VPLSGLTGRVVGRLVLAHEDPGDAGREVTQHAVLGAGVVPDARERERGLVSAHGPWTAALRRRRERAGNGAGHGARGRRSRRAGGGSVESLAGHAMSEKEGGRRPGRGR